VSLDEALGDTVRRLIAFGANPDRVTLSRRLPIPGDPLGDLRAAVEDVKPDVVVVDTLAEFVRDLALKSGDAGSWTPVIGGIVRLARDNNFAVLVLHHTRKDGAEYRDSTAIGASVDLILTMREAGGDARGRAIEVRGRLPVDGYTLRLVGDPHDPKGSPKWELKTGELSLDARILRFVAQNPEATTRQVRKDVMGRTGGISAALKRLLEGGALEDLGDSSGRRLIVPPTAPQGSTQLPLGDTLVPPPGSGGTPHGTEAEPGGKRTGNRPRYPEQTPRGGRSGTATGCGR
jgi:hypothetical protein